MVDRHFKCGVIFLLLSICSIMIYAEDTETCDDIRADIQGYNYYGYYFLWRIWSTHNNIIWYNMTFWGGHVQIPARSNVDNHCFAPWLIGLVVLTENHPNIDTLGDKVVAVKACSLNKDRVCQWDMEIYMRKCNGDLLYAFPWYNNTDSDHFGQYICFDRIYSGSCSDTQKLYSSGTAEHGHVSFNDGDTKFGWYNGYKNGKQYVFPSTDDLDTVFDTCLDHNGYILQEPIGAKIGEKPVRLSFCKITKMGDSNYFAFPDNANCFGYIYIRSCKGRLQFDLSNTSMRFGAYLCFIHKNNSYIKPGIRHAVRDLVIDNQRTKEHIPYLQYACMFEMEDGISYKTNWYINGTLKKQNGPSSQPEDLVFNETYLNDIPAGYEVQCGVMQLSGIETNESLSDVFYAGWIVDDTSISVSKSGFATLRLEQTLPEGCNYIDSDISQCYIELTFNDMLHNHDKCAGRIHVQDAKNFSQSSIVIKALTEGEEWKSSKNYEVVLSTIDNNYDDPTKYVLEVTLSRSRNHDKRALRNEVLAVIHVDVTDNNIHWNKRCYSHVDPHHKTSDGVYFEMQKPGDHMLYFNLAYQSEIQQSSRYCRAGMTSGPVCACGVAIRVGADAFVIDRCPGRNFTFDFVQCGDGGIIDIERIHDYRYTVRTPIGTVVDISLHIWSNTMNIDIYMSAKDKGNVVGLCGYFDGDSANDLLHRKGQTISYNRNRNYMFSDSWILTDEENMFTNKNRILQPWTMYNGRNSCTQPNSITRKKCDVPRRLNQRLTHRRRRSNSYFTDSRWRRNAVSFTEDEALQICNETIYTTTAVIQFPEKLAEEIPSIVLKQCVYDLTVGRDISWAYAHRDALNAAAYTILKLNPAYVANNSELVKSFLSKTCPNNCSRNGICTETGMCDCNGTFRGPDCSIDITFPPVVYDIQGGEICDTSRGDNCTCFVIRTDSIFEGFMCDMRKYKVYLTGKRIMEDRNIIEGDYHDTFTGVCCYPFSSKKRSVDDSNKQITLYEFSVSNDGSSYGKLNYVYVYDTTCIQQHMNGESLTFVLKDDFCFIDGVCVELRNIIDPLKGCDGTEPSGFKTKTVVGIVTASSVAIVLVTVLLYLLCLRPTKKNRTISHTNQQNSGKKNDIQQARVVKDKIKTVYLPRCEPARTKFRPYITSAWTREY